MRVILRGLGIDEMVEGLGMVEPRLLWIGVTYQCTGDSKEGAVAM